MVNQSTIRLIKELSDHISITRICAILHISRATYYRHSKNTIDGLTLTEVESRVHQLCIETHFLYGYRKIHALLAKETKCSVSKVQRIMRKHGWNCRIKIKRFNKPGNPYKAFANVINRNWQTDTPLSKLATDITYLPYGSHRLYLSTIMDIFNSEIIAYQLSDHPDTRLAVDTLNQLPTLPDNVTLHSDQGSTYTSLEFFDLARQKGITRSMSCKGTPADNAPIESFHSSLKSETFYHQIEPKGSRSIVIETVQNYIQFWNNTRIFTKLGNQSPVQYRESIA